MSAKNDIGVCGMAVMGRNLAMNFASKGCSVAVWNRTYSRTLEAIEEATREAIHLHAFEHLDDFVFSLKKPRKVIMLVQAGAPVEALISKIGPLLEEGDILIDGGNEQFAKTEERKAKMESTFKIKYMGMGVSGGEEGARYGPSLMPGGDAQAYKELEPLLMSVAAKIDPEETDPGKRENACVTFIGPGGAGNFVKMVHNGIEYGDMQLIAEAYHILKEFCGLDNYRIQRIFEDWNRCELQSFLIEITANIFKKMDDTGKEGFLVDYIKGAAGAKGTGKWTVLEGVEAGVPIPTIAAALDARIVSNEHVLRDQFVRLYHPVVSKAKANEVEEIIENVRAALYVSKLCSYAQGFMLLKKKSAEKNWNLNLSEIARIWKGGCIIRAKVLDVLVHVFKKNPGIDNILLDENLRVEILPKLAKFRNLLTSLLLSNSTLALPCISSSFFYINSLACEKLPQNLIQAQRDFFGAHTYERIDREGTFHSDWSKL